MQADPGGMSTAVVDADGASRMTTIELRYQVCLDVLLSKAPVMNLEILYFPAALYNVQS
ncbi:MAG: hypothetical protein NVSMB58_35760 [Terriglobales bacterium]